MRPIVCRMIAPLMALAFVGPAQAQQTHKDYPVKPVPFTAVQLTDKLWAPRIETNRAVTIPFAFDQCERNGRMDNFERAAAVLRGEKITNLTAPPYPFDDTDVYKVIEGAAYTLSVHPDPKLEAYIDTLVVKIAAAQEKDGYLYTTRTIDPRNPHRWAGQNRWELEKMDSHELYNLGHLYEAAVAYYQATGKRALLDVSLKTADLLCNTFGPGKRQTWPGHQITEMGLVRLYRVTGEQKYLDLARFLLDSRGPDGDKGAGRTYNQSHMKVIEQSEAVGHAVRATYMYSGMADVAALTGDQAYIDAMSRIWNDVVQKKLYITGGIGATGAGEAFGKPYELPNMTAYNETCAAIGNDYWNFRMFLLHGDSKYIDVMERTLYNGLLSGIGLDGKTFFYPNPLESRGQHARSPWFGVACCPSNVTRFLASIPGYVYAHRGDELYVNLFVANTATIKMDNRTVKLRQETEYPWDGSVRIVIEDVEPGEWTMKVRAPGWARNRLIPGDLYKFSDGVLTEYTLDVNPAGGLGKANLHSGNQGSDGYFTIKRHWIKGDVIQFRLPMLARRIKASDLVEADRDRVAIQRGPIVYAAEWPDNPDQRVRNLVVKRGDVSRNSYVKSNMGVLDGILTVFVPATALSLDANGRVTKKDVTATLIPYAMWANRGRGEMTVWLAETEAAANPTPFPTISTQSKITTSGRKNPWGVNDGEDPRNSADPSAYFDWWPVKGTSEWAEMTFASTATVSEVQLYWFDDTGRGEVRVPKQWRLLYRDGGEWKPVENASAFETAKDAWNRVAFKPVSTNALRLEVTSQDGFSSGIQEWRVK